MKKPPGRPGHKPHVVALIVRLRRKTDTDGNRLHTWRQIETATGVPESSCQKIWSRHNQQSTE